MPIETDCSNLLKHIDDASDGLERKIKSTEEDLNTLKRLESRKKVLVIKITNLQEEVDDFLDDAGSLL